MPPVIYLDTWAIRTFSEDEALGNRFRTALLRSGGTLALSDINLIEFTTFKLPQNTELAGRFIDSLFPHLFLMTCDPSKVILREEEHLAGRLDQSPAGDEKALVEFAQVVAKRGGRASMSIWFDIVHAEREQLKSQLPKIAEVFYKQLSRLCEQRDTNLTCLVPFANPEHIACGRPSTLPLLQAIVDGLQRDKGVSKSTNNAVDLLHTVVPSAYCDFVLLDGQWVDRLQRANTRLSAAAIPVRARAAYSRRKDGVESFLRALEHW